MKSKKRRRTKLTYRFPENILEEIDTLVIQQLSVSYRALVDSGLSEEKAEELLEKLSGPPARITKKILLAVLKLPELEELDEFIYKLKNKLGDVDRVIDELIELTE